MTDVRIVFSNQPLSYREAMANVVRALRPEADVTQCDPQNLETEIARVQPQLVICSDLADSIRSRLLAWVMLYPDGQDLATYSIAGRERQLVGIDLSGVLSLVDDVVSHIRASPVSSAPPEMTLNTIGG
jgi:hypothetical protein